MKKVFSNLYCVFISVTLERPLKAGWQSEFSWTGMNPKSHLVKAKVERTYDRRKERGAALSVSL